MRSGALVPSSRVMDNGKLISQGSPRIDRAEYRAAVVEVLAKLPPMAHEYAAKYSQRLSLAVNRCLLCAGCAAAGRAFAGTKCIALCASPGESGRRVLKLTAERCVNEPDFRMLFVIIRSVSQADRVGNLRAS